MGKAMRKEAKTGTVPVLNQMYARRITLITGVALSRVTGTLIAVSKSLLEPAATPRAAPQTVMRTKLLSALSTVEATSVKKDGEETSVPSEERTSSGEGRIIRDPVIEDASCHRSSRTITEIRLIKRFLLFMSGNLFYCKKNKDGRADKTAVTAEKSAQFPACQKSCNTESKRNCSYYQGA